jgi:hypothetical protein
MSPETLGWIGGSLGVVFGLLGGAVGTYFAVRNTRGPRERAFAVKMSIACWVFVALFVAGMFLLPGWYKHLLWVPYALILGFGIQWSNRVQTRIRQEEASGGETGNP